MGVAELAPAREASGQRIYQRPSEPLTAPPLELVVTPSLDAAGAARTGWKRVRVRPGVGSQVELRIPKDAVQAWSLSESLPVVPAHQTELVISIVGYEQHDAVIDLQVRPGATVKVQETFAPFRNPAVEDVLGHLPVWTTPAVSAIRRRTVTL